MAEMVLGCVPPTVVPYSMQSLSCTGQPSQGAMSSYTSDRALKEVERLVEQRGNKAWPDVSDSIVFPGQCALRSAWGWVGLKE